MSEQEKIKLLIGQLEQAKRYIGRLEVQNEAMRKRLNDPDRYPAVSKEDKFA